MVKQTMTAKYSDCLKSEFDVLSYAEYISGKRKYFTIKGAMIKKISKINEVHSFIKNKYKSQEINISNKVVEQYINAYNMSTGIISGYLDDTMPRLAYIENSFIFAADMLDIVKFEKINGDEVEKVIKKTFVPISEWDYETCTIVQISSIVYNLRKCNILQEIVIKNLKADVKKLIHNNKNIVVLKRQCRKTKKTVALCFKKIKDKEINNSERKVKIIEMLITITVVCEIVVLISFSIVFKFNKNNQSKELVCLY